MSYFIFIGCRKRVGKDVVADYISEELSIRGYNPIKESCVGYARKFVEELLPEFDRHSQKDEGISEYNNRNYRNTLISVIDPILKCDQLAFSRHFVNNYVDDKNIVYIIPDCRRLSEASFYRKELKDKSIFVNVTRPSQLIDYTAYGEGDIDSYDWDYTIINDDTLDSLKKKTDGLINIIVENVKKVNSVSGCN